MSPPSSRSNPSSSSDAPLAVEAAGICRRYGRRWALAGVDFTLRRGASLVLAGRNGSGKSTLLRVLATAIRADRGEARLDGFDIREHKLEVRHRTALLGHYSHLYEALTVLENLDVAARFLGSDTSRTALLERLAAVGLAERAHDPVMTLSAGMRKRLMLARVLLPDASIVLLDEPYGQLDPPGFRLVDEVIGRLRERGRTVLVATHLLERGAALCEFALVLEGGLVAWQGQASDLPREGGLLMAGPAEGAGT